MASMKDIKTRIRSVESTQQITRAMELVATSKLRHARERVERSRPFHEVLGEAIAGIQAGLKETPSVYSEVRPVKKTCFVVIGGDRGLAGGYNANLHRLVLSLAGSEPYCVLPIGKKAVEYFERHKIPQRCGARQHLFRPCRLRRHRRLHADRPPAVRRLCSRAL